MARNSIWRVVKMGPVIAHVDEFLDDAGLLPFSMWHCLEIAHHAPSDQTDENAVQEMIDREVDNANGLYVYSTPDGQVLYVGKGKPLKSRLWSDYLENFQTVKGDTKDNRCDSVVKPRALRVQNEFPELKGEAAQVFP